MANLAERFGRELNVRRSSNVRPPRARTTPSLGFGQVGVARLIGRECRALEHRAVDLRWSGAAAVVASVFPIGCYVFVPRWSGDSRFSLIQPRQPSGPVVPVKNASRLRIGPNGPVGTHRWGCLLNCGRAIPVRPIEDGRQGLE
jgi:hypothetical protein